MLVLGFYGGLVGKSGDFAPRQFKNLLDHVYNLRADCFGLL
jgi:hypothetical protein